MRGLLTQARNITVQFKTSHKECRSVEKGHSDLIKDLMTDLTVLFMKVEELLCTFRSGEWMTLAEVITLDVPRRNVLGFLRTLHP